MAFTPPFFMLFELLPESKVFALVSAVPFVRLEPFSSAILMTFLKLLLGYSNVAFEVYILVAMFAPVISYFD